MAPSIGRQTGKTVCVMDASSRIGAALVDRLLHRGYNIHAAAFGRGDGAKAVNCSESKRVRIFRSDPLDYHSIADAVRRCSGVFYAFDNDSYDEFMVEVEMRAAHNVLEACAQADTVEKVVFTSSVTAVIWKESRKLAEDFDERDWSDISFCRKFKLWHALAKTLSEKTAWALAMDRGVNMVAVNAGLLIEPKISPSNPYLKGAPEMYEDGVFVTVELKLLIDAHICIFESTGAFGRYLCFNHAICRPEDAVKLAQLLSPSAPIPPSSDELRVIQERIHSKKLNKLMLEFGDGLQVLMPVPSFDLPPSVFASAPMVANFSIGSSTFDLKAIFKSPPCNGLVAIPLGGGAPLRSSQVENVPDVVLSLLPNQEAEFMPLSRTKMGENPPADQRLSVVEGLIFNLNNQVFNLNNQVSEICNLRAELTASHQFLEANRFSLFHSGAEFMLRSLIKGGHISADILNDPSYKFWINQP